MAEKTVDNPIERTEEQTPTTREETRFLVPAVDIYETEDALMVMADLPGVSKDNVSVEVEKGILTIRGRVEHKAPADVLRQEFALLDYFRQFRLSNEVDQENIDAELRHGVLHLRLPKSRAAQPRRIEVRAD
jgi:HSP20 family molecular chaperone IbpA